MSRYGMLAGLGVAFQNSFDTAASVNSLMFVPFVSESLDPDIPVLSHEDINGIFDEHYAAETGPTMIGGDVVFNVKPIELGVFLKGAFGDPVSTLTGSVYVHAFTPRTDEFDIYTPVRPITLYKGLSTVASGELYSNMGLSALELTFNAKELVKGKVSFVGGKREYVAAQAVTQQAGRRFTWDVLSVQVGSGTGLVAHPEFTSLSFTADNALEAVHTLANRQYPSRLERSGFRKIGLSGTLKFDSHDEYDQFIASSDRRFLAHLVGKETVMTNTRNLLTIDIPAMRYAEFKKPIGGPGRIEINFSAVAIYHSGSGNSGKVTLVNTKAAY